MALIAPELKQELEHRLLDMNEWSEEGVRTYSNSLPCHPDTLKEMGTAVSIFKASTLAEAVRLMTVWDRKVCPTCRTRFAGATVNKDGVCLRCYTMFECRSPEDPCVVCQEDEQRMHGRLVVECPQCKKHTCMVCREKQVNVGRNWNCPACRCRDGIFVANTRSVKLCWYTGAK